MQQNRFRINIKSSFSCIFQLRRMAAVSPQQQNWRYSVLFCTYLSNKYRILCFPGFHSGLENVFVGVLMQLCRTDVYPGTICGRCFTVDGLDRPRWPRGAVCSVQFFPTPREEADSCSQRGVQMLTKPMSHLDEWRAQRNLQRCDPRWQPPSGL